MTKFYLSLSRYVTVLLMMTTTLAWSQGRTITGKVTASDDGSTMPGVNIVVKGTAQGTTTDVDGKYSLDVAGDATLIFTFVGYISKEVQVGNQSDISVILESDATALSEVVVVGYGAVKKKDLTGSVAQVNATDFNKGIYVSPGQLLQGKIAGVLVTGSSGAPGAEVSIRIRGNSTIRGGNSPLIVVDGMQLDNGTAKTSFNVPGGVGNTPGIDPLSFINPNDIETFDVLKDASATAIYGSRGSNGVIMITTKKGRGDRIEFSASTGVSTLSKKLDTMTADQYRNALSSEGIAVGDFGSSVNAFDQITQTGSVQNYNIGFSTGNEKASHRLSIGYTDQKGIIKESGLKKFNAMVKSNYNFFNDRVKVDMLLLGSDVNQASAPIGNNSATDGNLISQALQWNPTRDLFDDNGAFVQPGGVEVNPLALLKAYDDKFVMDRIIATVAPTINIAKGLDYRIQVGIDHMQGDRALSIKKLLTLTGGNLGTAFLSSFKLTTEQVTQTLSWNKEMGSVSLNAIAGYEFQKSRLDGLSVSATGFTDDAIDFVKNIQNATASNTGMGYAAPPDTKLQSFFGRANLNFDDKFLFTATVRADGSSRFGANNRYGVFPAAAIAWNLHKQTFLPDAVNNAKLRLGWGQTGNQQFPAGSSLDRWSFASGGGTSTVTQANLGNPNLKWETTSTINAGIDFGIFNNRITGSIDYFDRKTTNILFNVTTPQPGPAISYWTNLDAQIRNNGVEIALNSYIVDNDNFKWQFGGNVSFLKNKYTANNDVILYTGAISGKGLSGVTSQVIAKNQPLNEFYLRKWTGIGSDGLSTYEGYDEISGGSPRKYVGSPNPNMIVGITTSVTYKKFDATVNFNGAFGHMIYNNTANAVFVKGNLGSRNTSKDLVGNNESPANISAASTRYLEKGDFLRLANLSLGYTVATDMRAIKNLRFYLTGQNLLLFTKYSGFDPEVNTDKNVNGVPSYGIEYTPYPRARTILIGLTAAF
jgi:TonB-linked SusC/RagA family outer membrane protein